ERSEVCSPPRARQGEGSIGTGRRPVLPTSGTHGFCLRHLPWRHGQADPSADPALFEQARGSACRRWRVARVPRLARPGHDPAARHRRLLLADASAARRLWLRRDDSAHHVSRPSGQGWRHHRPVDQAMNRPLLLIAAIAAIAVGGYLLFPWARDASSVDAAVKASWTAADPGWLARLVPGETQKEGSRYPQTPPPAPAHAVPP